MVCNNIYSLSTLQTTLSTRLHPRSFHILQELYVPAWQLGEMAFCCVVPCFWRCAFSPWAFLVVMAFTYHFPLLASLRELAVCRCVRVRQCALQGVDLYSRPQAHRTTASLHRQLVRSRRVAPCASLESAPQCCSSEEERLEPL